MTDRSLQFDPFCAEGRYDPATRRRIPSDFASNVVITSRYTVFTFLPMNLFEQITQISNFYFLCIGVLQAIPQVSTSGGIPNMYIPLVFILFVSGLRAAVEDYRRHKLDEREGSRQYEVFVCKDEDNDFEGWRKTKSRDLRVGHIVKVLNDQIFPADLLFLRSANARGHCFVETSSLDGETDLKAKIAVAATHNIYDSEQKLQSLGFKLRWQAPNKNLDEFRGSMVDLKGGQPGQILMHSENLLLRGTVLKNTEYIYGVVVYTGEETKVRCNAKVSKTARVPKSTLMRLVDRCILVMLLIQVLICILYAIGAGAWSHTHSRAFYLGWGDTSLTFDAFLRFFTWFIIMSQLVPISLIVSAEIVKVFQAFYIEQDLEIYDESTDNPTIVRSSVLNEELGQIEYIFSDKTGTLTQNRMEFRVAVVHLTPYGSMETEISKRVTARRREQADRERGLEVSSDRESWTQLVQNIQEQRARSKALGTAITSFDAREKYLRALWLQHEDQPQAIRGPSSSSAEADELSFVRTFLTHMAISNTVNPIFDEKLKGFVFQATSPDELAFAKFAQLMGFELVGRNPTVIKITQPNKAALDRVRSRLDRGDLSVPEEESLSTVLDKRGETIELSEQYDQLGTLAFNSKRKRVTVIYRPSGSNRVLVMTKGADTNMLPLLHASQHEVESLQGQLDIMAANGLRTLVLAHAELPIEWWEGWKEKYQWAATLPESGDETKHQYGACTEKCRICAVCGDIEKSAKLTLLGATAIEDRLQELVPEAIQDFLEAKVKVWMLTGDKRETAKNIALACNLIDPDMENTHDWSRNRLIEVTGHWSKMMQDPRELEMLFSRLDLNRDGLIDKHDLLESLKQSNTPGFGDGTHIDALLAHGDRNKDGCIDRSDFIEIMQRNRMSLLESVIFDVSSGLDCLHAAIQNKQPVSMVIEGEALAVLYPSQRMLQEHNRLVPFAQSTVKSTILSRLMAPRDSSIARAKNNAVVPFNSGAKAESKESSEPVTVIADVEEQGRLARSETLRAIHGVAVSEEVLQTVRDRFFDLAVHCKSVVCCRLTPFQKAKIVDEIKKRKGAITLAVGDGANDEAMILEAHVGVGITGLEGTAASRASAYAIGQFRFLHTLLFVHGAWSYRRIAKLVPYIFYKAIAVVMTMFWFGIVSGFSGQQLVDDFIYSFYNVMFTALPVLVLAIWDQSLDRVTLENNPTVYNSLTGGALFTKRTFALWIARSVIHALIIVAIVFASMPSTFMAKAGYAIDYWLNSITVYTAVVLLMTFRIALEFRSITWFHIAALALSIIAYFPTIILATLRPVFNANMLGVVVKALGLPVYWLTVLLAVSIPLILDGAIEAMHRSLRPTVSDVLAERRILSEADQANLPSIKSAYAKTAALKKKLSGRQAFSTSNNRIAPSGSPKGPAPSQSFSVSSLPHANDLMQQVGLDQPKLTNLQEMEGSGNKANSSVVISIGTPQASDSDGPGRTRYLKVLSTVLMQHARSDMPTPDSPSHSHTSANNGSGLEALSVPLIRSAVPEAAAVPRSSSDPTDPEYDAAAVSLRSAASGPGPTTDANFEY